MPIHIQPVADPVADGYVGSGWPSPQKAVESQRQEGYSDQDHRIAAIEHVNWKANAQRLTKKYESTPDQEKQDLISAGNTPDERVACRIHFPSTGLRCSVAGRSNYGSDANNRSFYIEP